MEAPFSANFGGPPDPPDTSADASTEEEIDDAGTLSCTRIAAEKILSVGMTRDPSNTCPRIILASSGLSPLMNAPACSSSLYRVSVSGFVDIG